MTDPAFNSSRPSFQVGGVTQDDIPDSLTGLVVNIPLNGVAHAEMTLTNWGIIDGETTPGFLFTDLSLGDQVDILFGESDSIQVFSGEITALEECYGEGAPHLVVLLQDKLHRLARARRSRSFESVTPDDVVGQIAGDAGLQSDAAVSDVNTDFHQMNESDLAFLFRVLGRFDISLRLEGETLRARVEEPDSEPVVLSAQDSALNVRLIADLNHQFSASEALGYNLSEDESAEGTAENISPAPDGTTAADIVNELGWPGEELVGHPFARSTGEAQGYSAANFTRCAKRFVSGDIACQGEPTLRSGREIELDGVSDRLSGVYKIVHCVHRFDSEQGYQTLLKVNRPDWSA